MATTAQNEANIANAPQAVLLTEDDRQEWQTLISAYEYELRPATPIERTLFDTLVLSAWNIQRANRLEVAMCINGIDPLLSGEQDAKQLDRISTYRMRAERTFHKSHKELRALIAARPPMKAFVKNEPKFMDAHLQGSTQPGPKPEQPAPIAPSAKLRNCLTSAGGTKRPSRSRISMRDSTMTSAPRSRQTFGQSLPRHIALG